MAVFFNFCLKYVHIVLKEKCESLLVTKNVNHSFSQILIQEEIHLVWGRCLMGECFVSVIAFISADGWILIIGLRQ